MRTIFLSDVHLKGQGTPAQERFLLFLDRHCLGEGGGDLPGAATGTVVDHLVVAGDFFDFWFERRGVFYPGFRPVVERLSRLAKAGVRISLCEGNHDFFLGDFFQQRLGIEVFTEWMTLAVDGCQMLVAHGDTVDRSNWRYLGLRRFLRSPLACFLQRLLPLPLLWGVARLGSAISKGVPGVPPERLVKSQHRFAQQKFQEGIDAVILGHSHRSLLQEECHAGRPKVFAALGDWSQQGSFLLYEGGRFTMNRFDDRG